MIVTVVPTIMDGTVVRWYRTVDATPLDAAEPQHMRGEELLSASRNGVRIHCYLHQVPEDVLAAARGAHEALRRDRDADLRHLATHRSKRLLSDELVPVEVSQRG